MTNEEIIKEFFNKLADKLEEHFEKGELCQCGKRLPCRSNALSFNAYANLYLKEALASQKDYIKNLEESLSFANKQIEFKDNLLANQKQELVGKGREIKVPEIHQKDCEYQRKGCDCGYENKVSFNHGIDSILKIIEESYNKNNLPS